MPLTQRRARDTRSSLLQAARDVFTEVGYAEANVADVVARAGSSVGSMYHHFGGKADLYFALYDDYQSRQEARADAAVREAYFAGERDPMSLFVAGSRATYRGCWEERDLTRLFLAGDGPPAFDMHVRARFREWVRRGSGLLGDPGDQTFGEALMLVLTQVNYAAAREVAMQPDEETATRFAEEVLKLLPRIGSASPSPEPAAEVGAADAE